MPATRTMKHGERDPRSTTGEILSQLRPRSLVRDGRDLVVKFQNDDVFRSYVAYRAWALIAVMLVFVLVSTVLSVTVMFDVARWVPAPAPLWLRALALLISAVVWVGGIVAQAYLFVLWLEGKAARLDRSSRGMIVAVPKGLIPYLKYSRTLAPWILALLCVVLPLAVLAANSPVAAAVLALVTVLAPVLFSRLDP